MSRKLACGVISRPEDEVVQVDSEIDYVAAYHGLCETVSHGVKNNRSLPEAEWQSPITEGVIPSGDLEVVLVDWNLLKVVFRSIFARVEHCRISSAN